MSDQKIAVLDLAPASADFREQVIDGLSRQPRTLPCKFFYDETGSALFGKICELPEYYITRTEMALLRERGSEIARALGPGLELIGLGTGAGTKTRLLLDHLQSPVAYVPVDISKEQLAQSTAAFSRIFPSLEILLVSADYLEPFELPTPLRMPLRKAVYFPGSTIGNLEPKSARAFLGKIAAMAGADGLLLMGVDLKKSKAILELAYNDDAGVTAKFNLNLLERANRELDANFDLPQWRHHAFYNEQAGRIEMHLVSSTEQTVRISQHVFGFVEGEHIITEFSYKYSPGEMIALAADARFRFEKLWTDEAELFGLFLFVAPSL
ncbi:MAG: L-histidine N(alpha)-methyltransferase [Chthoniobacterales bacterium]|nr:MAG: L-histidine N(alpha)-methyltransferase [Chthoniobacterales bacterium]